MQKTCPLQTEIWKANGKSYRKIWVVCLLLVLCGMLCTGCRITDMRGEERKDMEYTIVPEDDIPEEIKALIDEKKEKEFRLSYQNEDYLYLIRGYGEQPMGGYSVQLESLTMSEEAIFMKTKLMGPSKEEKQTKEPSYPYLVVKVEYLDKPVQFE